MTTMFMAVSSRAALGHSGRPLGSTPLLNSAFLLISMSAVLRVLASEISLATLIWAAGLLWLAAFLCYIGAVLPILIKPGLESDPAAIQPADVQVDEPPRSRSGK